MIVLKSTYDELEAKHASVVKENQELKSQVEASKALVTDKAKFDEMEASVKLAVESCDTLTKENAELKAQIESLKAEQVVAEVRAQQITASQGVPPVSMSSEDIQPKASLLTQLGQIRNATEQRKFWEAHQRELKQEILDSKK